MYLNSIILIIAVVLVIFLFKKAFKTFFKEENSNKNEKIQKYN